MVRTLPSPATACPSPGWYLPDLANAYSEAIALRLQEDRALVPPLWQMELANVLKAACTRGKLQLIQARQILDALGQLPIDIDTGPAPGQRHLFELCMRYGLSSYDAAYLELAMRHGLPITTRDEQLIRATDACGLGIVAPSP